jgi:hypothetical protein
LVHIYAQERYFIRVVIMLILQVDHDILVIDYVLSVEYPMTLSIFVREIIVL